MRILLTNDDGIYAPGIFALYKALKSDYDVDVVAPELEMSAVGHGITLSLPLRVREVKKNGSFFGYAVSGTPADCVKLAVGKLLERPPDIILSGINLGANVGVNLLYSGTVSAAMEGAYLGFKSAAISLNTVENSDFRFAARFSREIIRFIIENDIRKGTALNVNVPAVPEEEISGVCITRQGTVRFEDVFERYNDPRGNTYYWLSGAMPVEDSNADTDYMALKENKITITPVNCDLTCDEELARLKECDPPKVTGFWRSDVQ